MKDIIQLGFSALTLLGVGGIIGAYLTYLLDKKKEREFRVLEQKERRYKSCLLFMDAYFEPQNIKYLASRHPDINRSQDVLEYLRMEYHEMMLYASREVVLAVKLFIETPNRANFLKAILVMRNDLSRGRNDIDMPTIALNDADTEKAKTSPHGFEPVTDTR